MRLTVYFPEDSPTTHEVVGEKLTIGRLVGNDVALDEASVSSRHAEIVLQDGGAAVLRDLDSTNGTFLNGEQVTGEHPLVEGDEIYFGSVRSVFMEQSSPTPAVEVALEQTAAQPSVDFSGGGRPDNFRPLSPFPAAAKGRDVLALLAWSSLGLGVLCALYALLVTFTS